MEDSQQGNNKKKNKVDGNYALWTPEESNELLWLMVDVVKNGWCVSSGGLSKIIVEKKILYHLNEKFGRQRPYTWYQSRLKWFKIRFHKLSISFDSIDTHFHGIQTWCKRWKKKIIVGMLSRSS